MPIKYTFSRWSIELTHGWTAQTREEFVGDERNWFVAIVPETNDAVLRLTPDERNMMEAARWVELVATINRAMGRPVSATRCGDLAGCAVEFISSDEWLRGWALAASSFPLDVTYFCRLENARRDDPVVDSMLNTLRLEKV
jgi:hypothetical protein